MTAFSKSRKFVGRITWPRRALLCLVQGAISRTQRKGLLVPRIFPKRRLLNVAGTSAIGLVPPVAGPVSVAVQANESCTTSATWFPVDLATSISSTPNTVARAVACTSTLTCRTTHCQSPITPIASWPCPCGWSWRMAYRIKPPVGISGVTTEFLSLTPRSRTGWKPGGKKAARQVKGSYLNWALADFSGYIAADLRRRRPSEPHEGAGDCSRKSPISSSTVIFSCSTI